MSDTPACCPSGSWPQLLTTPNEDLNKEDVATPPKGELVSVPVEGHEDLPIYYVEATTSDSKPCKGSILVIPDIYSVRVLLPTVRSGDRIGSICDALAAEGYSVALAGVFRDDPYDQAVKGPEDGDFVKFDSFAQDGGVPWFQLQTYEKMGPAVQAAAKFLKEKDDGKLGVLGFCYGTWLLSKTSSTGDVDFDCAVGCHPATVLEKAVFGRDEDAMLDDLKQPTAFLWAGNDSDIYTKEGTGKASIEKSGGRMYEFPDMLHGWVSRGDVADEAVKTGVETAMKNITDFFAEHMGGAQ